MSLRLSTEIPWVSAVFYVPDADDTLCWVSDFSARHSQNTAITSLSRS
jgi:hypothetical protein